jgi:hypothetical protein
MGKTPFQQFSDEVDRLIVKADGTGDPVVIQGGQILKELRSSYKELTDETFAKFKEGQAQKRQARNNDRQNRS